MIQRDPLGVSASDGSVFLQSSHPRIRHQQDRLHHASNKQSVVLSCFTLQLQLQNSNCAGAPRHQLVMSDPLHLAATS